MNQDRKSTRTLLITGAAGFVGGRLADYAMERGFLVRTLVRRDWDGEPAVPVECRHLGSLPGRIPREMFDGVDAVINCAAYAGKDEKIAEAVNVEGPAVLARIARDAKVNAFIHLSSSSAREDSPAVYARSKLAGERRILSCEGLNVVVIRPNLVVGPGQGGVFGRMRSIVEKMPVIPMLGGGRAIVQPIHVDDLCDAVLRAIARARELAGSVLALGDPGGITLKELFQTIAMATVRKKRVTVTIPIAPVKAIVRLTEAAGIPLPITSANLAGLERIEIVETSADNARLGLKLRPANDLGLETMRERSRSGLDRRAVRILLVGAGKAGLVHAFTASRLNGIVLAGVVDPNAGARRLLAGAGIRAPGYGKLEEAIASCAPDAAIVATPVSFHYPITRACVEKGIGVLVEKPMAVSAHEIGEFEKLHWMYPRTPIHPGWVMLRNPHVRSGLQKLHGGEYGTIRSFTGYSLLSSVHKRDDKRWEMNPAISGGGAYVAAGGHVLSMIHAAFGRPSAVVGEFSRIHSRLVEDSLIARFEYPGFSGVHYCSWSIRGYTRLESSLIVETDRGTLVLTPSVSVFTPEKGASELVHQLDTEERFNMAPDYAGAGFTSEICDLATAVRGNGADDARLLSALDLERMLHEVVASCRETTGFARSIASVSIPSASPAQSHRDEGQAGAGVKRILDLRNCTHEAIGEFVRNRSRMESWDGFLILPGAAKIFRELRIPDERVRITVPDFIVLSRMLITGRHLEVIRSFGLAGILHAGVAVAAKLPGERGVTLWGAATGMTAGALAAIPYDFGGTLLLHPYLADLALAGCHLEQLDHLLSLMHRIRPRARLGFHSGMAAEAAAALPLLSAPIDDISTLVSPGAAPGNRAMFSVDTNITGEVGMAPASVHIMAAAAPSTWDCGVSALVIGSEAEPGLASAAAGIRAEAWKDAFPV